LLEGDIVFKKAVKSELNQISLTGIRSLVLLGLLTKAPRSLEEIREAFISYNIMDDSNSDDILRIDLNTLRAMGCEISRSCQRTNHKYELTKHPFMLKISSDEIDVLRRTFKKIKNKTDIEILVEYDELFNKIAQFVSDDDTKEALVGLCSLKSYNIEQINELYKDCKSNKILNLIYKSPTSANKEEMVITAEKLELKNDKVYLFGFDLNKKQSVMLNIKRIISILSKKDGDDSNKTIPIKVSFLLKDFTIIGLDNDENIIEKNENGYLIEGNYFNEFIATQRILSFGSSCTVISPIDFKNKIIENLKKIKDIYNG